MLRISYTAERSLNAQNLGIEVGPDAILAPEALRVVLESMAVRSADALAAALTSFPTAIASHIGMDSASFAVASAGALELLRPHVDSRVLQANGSPQRRGMGAMPPRQLKTN